MSHLITAITCTGNRPEAFALCETYMRRQTRKPDQWIIISDDGVPPKKQSSMQELDAEYYAGPRTWESGLNTHRFNMEEALKHVEGDAVVIFEDDDYYAPTYIEEMTQYLGIMAASGITNSKYYHVGLPGYKEMLNNRHASLSNTVFHKSVLPLMIDAVNSGEMYFDLVFWSKIFDTRTPANFFCNSKLSVGIKGMPGREGLTPSHKELRDYRLDPGYEKLKSLVGEDWKLYEPFRKKVTRNETQNKVQTGNGQNVQDVKSAIVRRS